MYKSNKPSLGLSNLAVVSLATLGLVGQAVGTVTPEQPSSTELQQNQTSAKSTPDRPVVILLDQGEEERSLLRYSLTPGDTYEMDLVLHAHRSRTINLQGLEKNTPIPPIHVRIESKALETGDERLMAVRTRLTSLVVQQGPELGSAGVAHIQSYYEAIVGLTFTQVFETTGALVSSQYDTGALSGDEGELFSVWTTLLTLWNIERVVVPLPTEPVGVGAQWQIAGNGFDYSYGAPIPQTNLYTLKESRNGNLSIEYDSRSSLRDPVNISDRYELPVGCSAQLDMYESSTKFLIDLNLDSVGYVRFNGSSDLRIEKAFSDASGNKGREVAALGHRANGERVVLPQADQGYAVLFTATWSGPDRRIWKEMAQKFRELRSKGVLCAVAFDERSDGVTEHLPVFGFTPVCIDEMGQSQDVSGGIRSLPSLCLFDSAGTLVWRGHPNSVNDLDFQRIQTGQIASPLLRVGRERRGKRLHEMTTVTPQEWLSGVRWLANKPKGDF